MIPPNLAEKMVEVWGEEGSEWIARFPKLLQEASAKWKLTDLEPAPGLSYNFVAFAKRGGMPVVLKLAVNSDHLENEARVLQAYAGKHAAKLIDGDPKLGAILLERLVPGIPLWSTWTVDKDNEQTHIAADLILRAKRPGSEDFPTIERWCRAFKRCLNKLKSNHPDYKLIENAMRLAAELRSDGSQEGYLLHGDLHHGNILSSGDSWKFIDPKGVVGELAFEAGAFLRNPTDRILGVPDLAGLIDRRLHIFAEVLNLDMSRLKAWCFCVCVLSICWSIEDNDTNTDAAMACARVLSI